MDDRHKHKGFWKYMLGYISQYKKDLVFTVIASLLVGICIACQPFAIKFIVDNGISNASLSPMQKMKYIGVLCILYIVVAVLRMGFWKVGLRHVLQALEGTIFNLRSKFFSHVQHMCMRFHDQTSAGELFNCIMGSPIINIKEYMRQIFINVPYQAVHFVVSVSALIYYDKILTLIMLITAAVMAVVNFFSRKKIKAAFSDYIKTESEASHYLNDMLHGMDAVKLYSIEDYTFKSFKHFISAMYEKSMHAVLSQETEAQKPAFVQFVGIAVIYFAGAYSCIFRGMQIGVLYAFISCMTTILGTLTSWLTIGLSKSSATAGLHKILAILDTDTSTPDNESGRMRSVEVERSSAKAKNKPCISFENVSFSYNDKPIFKNLNCDIKYNESIALVGTSGSGKSTFTKLPMRLYDVSEGTVKLHGCDVRSFSLHDLRVSFGIVPQKPFIFSGTIWENVTIAHPDASSRDVIRAMEIAHVHEFVNELPDGWMTRVGDGALTLSGGQSQRIAIARAILGNPDILIFDEATSALDNVSEHHIQQAMEELMKTHTVLVVAHRLSTIRNVDRVMVFDRGEIVEEGTYEELAKKEGLFKDLLTVSGG